MPTAYGYTRASTAGQTLTFEAQRAAITAYYESTLKPQGFAWGGFFEDKATSARIPWFEREEGRRLWAITLPGDSIVCSKLDRAFRSVVDGAKTLPMLKDKGLRINFLDIGLDTSTTLGEFVACLLVLLAQLERSWISERTKAIHLDCKARNYPITRAAPAGWRKVGPKGERQLIPDYAERKLLDIVFHCYLKGARLVDLQNSLRAKGHVRANNYRINKEWLSYAMLARAAGYPQNWYYLDYRKASRADRKSGKRPKNGPGTRRWMLEKMRQLSEQNSSDSTT